MKPLTHYTNPLDGVVSELMSAMSALNMEPDPLPRDQWPDKEGGPVYLSERDAWAKHSMEHMHAAFDQAAKVASAERSRILAILREVEAAHFRTQKDTGANPTARLVWNSLRARLGLPSITLDDLPSHDGKAYMMPPNSRLLTAPAALANGGMV